MEVERKIEYVVREIRGEEGENMNHTNRAHMAYGAEALKKGSLIELEFKSTSPNVRRVCTKKITLNRGYCWSCSKVIRNLGGLHPS